MCTFSFKDLFIFGCILCITFVPTPITLYSFLSKGFVVSFWPWHSNNSNGGVRNLGSLRGNVPRICSTLSQVKIHSSRTLDTREYWKVFPGERITPKWEVFKWENALVGLWGICIKIKPFWGPTLSWLQGWFWWDLTAQFLIPRSNAAWSFCKPLFQRIIKYFLRWNPSLRSYPQLHLNIS